MTATHLAGSVSRTGAFSIAATRASWRDVEIVGVVGSAGAERESVELAWERGALGRVTVGHGALTIDPTHQLLQRGAVDAYGGRVTLVRPAAVSGSIELGISGVQLPRVLAALSSRASGHGALDGTLVIRAGEVERAELHARGSGAFRIGDPRWVAEAVARIDAGEVAMSRRIGGALADFEYDALSLSFTAAVLRVELRGSGRRVPQVLDLVINVRGLREAARFLARARRSS